MNRKELSLLPLEEADDVWLLLATHSDMDATRAKLRARLIRTLSILRKNVQKPISSCLAAPRPLIILA